MSGVLKFIKNTCLLIVERRLGFCYEEEKYKGGEEKLLEFFLSEKVCVLRYLVTILSVCNSLVIAVELFLLKLIRSILCY